MNCRAGLNALDQALATRDARWQDDEGEPHQLALRIANASFAQRGWSIEPSYLDAIASDVRGRPAARRLRRRSRGRAKRDQCVGGDQTAKPDPGAAQPPDVSTSTRLYLVNAIYLKAEWERAPFEDGGDGAGSFARLDGSTVTVADDAPRAAGSDTMCRSPWRRLAGDRPPVRGAPAGRPRSR